MHLLVSAFAATLALPPAVMAATPSPPDALAAPTFPRLVAVARLPSADRLQRRVAIELGGQASPRVRLCVAPTGTVDAVALLSSSGLTAFDAAVLVDVARWRFAAYPAPTGTRVCQATTIAYVTP